MPVNQVKPKVTDKANSANSAKTTFLADTVATQETDKFARSLLKRLRETQKLAASPVKLEIKVGREINYRGIEGQAPEVSKLSPAAIAYLNAAIKIPQADPAQLSQADKALNRAVTIKVDNEVVFRLNKGVVETNKLHPELAKQISQAVSIDVQATPELVEAPRPSGQRTPEFKLDQQEAFASREITAKSVQEGEADHSVSGYKDIRTISEATPASEFTQAQGIAGDPLPPPPAAKLVPALAIMEREVQKQPEGSVRQYLGQAVQALKAASQLAGVKIQQRMKDLPNQAHAIAGKAHNQVQHQLKQLPQQVANLPEVVRDRQIADTAVQLLDRYGGQDDQARTYQAANYTIRATGKNTYSISDNHGKELMKFKQSFLGPQILSNHMSPRQQKDFTRVRSQIQIQGGTPFLPADPAMRVRQLQGLAPATDVALAQEGKNIAAVTSVQNVLKTLGRDRYQNDHYRFQQRGNALTVSAKDGRGEILSLKDGEIAANLKPLDISYLRQLDRQVSQANPSQSTVPPPAKQVELVD